jgi:hypothetical protein
MGNSGLDSLRNLANAWRNRAEGDRHGGQPPEKSQSGHNFSFFENAIGFDELRDQRPGSGQKPGRRSDFTD